MSDPAPAENPAWFNGGGAAEAAQLRDDVLQAAQQQEAAAAELEVAKKAEEKRLADEKRFGEPSQETKAKEAALDAAEEALQQAQEEYQRKIQETQDARLGDLEDFKRKAHNQIEQLTTEGHNHSSQKMKLKAELERLQNKLADNAEKEAKLDNENFWLESATDLETIQAGKMELDEIAQWQASLQQAIDTHALTLEMINEAREERESGSSDILQKAMAHAAYLEAEVNSGKYDINAKVRFVEWLKLASKDNATEDEKASVGEYSMIDEIMEQRRSARSKAAYANENILQALNNERFDRMTQERELLRQKHELQLLRDRGIETLVELELGGAPPKEFLLKNIFANPDISNDPPEPAAEMGLDAVLQKVKALGDIETLRQDLYKPGGLHDSINWDRQRVAYYDGSLKLDDSHSVAVVRTILKEVVNRAINSIPEVPNLAKVENDRRLNERETLELQRDAEVSMHDHAINETRDALLMEVVNETIEELYLEALETRQLFAGIMAAKIVGITKSVRQTLPNEEPLLMQTYNEMRRQRRLHGSKAKNRFVVRMDTPAQVEDPTMSAGGIAWQAVNPVFLKPEPSMRLDPKGDLKKGRISAVAISACGTLLAAGSDTGCLFVWSFTQAVQRRLRKRNDLGGVVSQLSFGYDSLRLAAVVILSDDDDGLRTCSKIFALAHADPTEPLSRLGEFKAPTMGLDIVLTSDDVRRPGDERSTTDNMLTTRCIGWHPGFALLGTSESFLVGLENGTVAKCNPLSRATAAAIGKGGMGLASRPFGQAAEAEVEVEYFQGHTEPVRFLGAKLTEDLVPLLVSADEAGVIIQWRYESESFTGFKHFDSAFKSRLNMAEAICGSHAMLTAAVMGQKDMNLILCLLSGAAQTNQNIGALAAISLSAEDHEAPLKHKVELEIVKDEPVSLALAVINGADIAFVASFKSIKVYGADGCVPLQMITPPWVTSRALKPGDNKVVWIAASPNGTIAMGLAWDDQVHIITCEPGANQSIPMGLGFESGVSLATGGGRPKTGVNFGGESSSRASSVTFGDSSDAGVQFGQQEADSDGVQFGSTGGISFSDSPSPAPSEAEGDESVAPSLAPSLAPSPAPSNGNFSYG